jgi:hypothetical protein
MPYYVNIYITNHKLKMLSGLYTRGSLQGYEICKLSEDIFALIHGLMLLKK